VLALAAVGCAASEKPAAGPAQPATEIPAVVATPLGNPAPAQSDAVPLWSLAFEYASGARIPIAEHASAYTRFRDGVALIDRKRRLLLISPDGSRRTLSSTTATTPVLGPSGELYYVARYGTLAELHRLSTAGRDDVIARELSSIALLAPQADGSVLLAGARDGGFAGVWRIAAGANSATCATNCELRTGQPWQGRFVPPPGTAAELEPAYRASQQVEVENNGGVLRGEP
jgi:hypothetical protein